jgi:ppGpp synthetase/RelA/SpoT-type nucleotidyltranferase
MDFVDSFLARYRREYDFFDQAGRLAAQVLEGPLRAAGIRSIVTSRAKGVDRLEEKVRTRGKNYTSVEDIFEDIVDLAGVRVAMYFAGQHTQVDTIIRESFDVQDEKEFPVPSAKSKSPNAKPPYDKRFPGYLARHYRVHLKDSVLSDTQKRYAEARIEIQVASVLMHSWAEVEHDLVYKPQEGKLSYEEHSILDQINGLVLTGEIALEQLQRAVQSRVAAGRRKFSNHYDLAAHLLGSFDPSVRVPTGETALGRIDLLFEFLNQEGLVTPDKLKQYIPSLTPDLKNRPLTEQIVTQLGNEDPTRYTRFEKLRASRPVSGDYVRRKGIEEVDRFLERWVAFEQMINAKAKGSPAQNIYPSSTLLSRLGVKDETLLKDFERIRRMRDEVVHGLSMPSPEDLRDACGRIDEISKQLEHL